MKDLLVTFGDEVKVTSSGKVSGYLIRFGGTDLDGDFFTLSCDFGRPTKVGDSFKMNLYYAHGMDEVVGKETVGTGRIVVKDAGLWYEGQIEISNEYRMMIARLGQEGRLGFSSGAASHLVERKSVGNASQIIRWNIAEASLTPKPAEPRNMANAKSLKNIINIGSNFIKAQFDVDDYVQWDSSGGTAIGQIVAMSDSGTLTPIPNGKPMIGTSSEPVYKIRVYKKRSDGAYELGDIQVTHRAGALTKINEPIKDTFYGMEMQKPAVIVESNPSVALVRPKSYTYAFPQRAEVQGMNTMRNNVPMSEEEMMRRRYMVPREDSMQGYMPVMPNTTAYPAIQGYMPIMSPSTHYPATQGMSEMYEPQGYMQTVPMIGYGRSNMPMSEDEMMRRRMLYQRPEMQGYMPDYTQNMQSPFSSCKMCGSGVHKGMSFCPSCGAASKNDESRMPMAPMPMARLRNESEEVVGELMREKPEVEVNPQVLSTILSHLMQAYYDMIQAMSEGEDRDAYDSYHSKLMKEWDMFNAAGKSFLSERVRPLNQVQSIPMTFSKSKPLTVSEFEKRVRDAFGLSRREAKTVASHGWKALCDAGVAALTEEVESESKAIIWEDAPQVDEPVVQNSTEEISEEPVKKPRRKQVATPVAEPVTEEVTIVEGAKSVEGLNTDADDDNDESENEEELSEEAKAVSGAKRDTLMRQLMLQQLASQEG
jgi:phage head maturation protease